VDGYNVLRVSLNSGGGSSWWSEERRAALSEVASRLPHPEDEIFLVFDARHLSEASEEPNKPNKPNKKEGRAADAGPSIVQVFAPSADEWIVRAVKRSAAERSVVVVTADRPLRDRSRHHGADWMSTGDFVALCEGRSTP
jgi:predicted RNA-binding protein with PIN domain